MLARVNHKLRMLYCAACVQTMHHVIGKDEAVQAAIRQRAFVHCLDRRLFESAHLVLTRELRRCSSV